MTGAAEKRHEAILRAISEGDGIVISELAANMQVSEMTIRRDLQELENEGLLIRVHGGAIPTRGQFSERLSANTAAKKKATEKLAEFIPRRGVIYLDGSTTVLNLIGRMKHSAELQVVTNNVETYQRVKGFPGVDPLLLGGKLDRRTENLVGALTVHSIESLAFEKAFFSAWGLDPGLGPTEMTIEDAEVKDMIAKRARQVFIAVDESKLTRTGVGNWHPDRERSCLATNLAPDSSVLDPYRERFHEIL
jgi:DeoR family fructose operon transcriptional repressor